MILHLFFRNKQQASTKSMVILVGFIVAPNPCTLPFTNCLSECSVIFALPYSFATWHFPGTCGFVVCFFAGLGVLLICSFLFLLSGRPVTSNAGGMFLWCSFLFFIFLGVWAVVDERVEGPANTGGNAGFSF